MHTGLIKDYVIYMQAFFSGLHDVEHLGNHLLLLANRNLWNNEVYVGAYSIEL